jgi:hypothetical protein
LIYAYWPLVKGQASGQKGLEPEGVWTVSGPGRASPKIIRVRIYEQWYPILDRSSKSQILGIEVQVEVNFYLSVKKGPVDAGKKAGLSHREQDSEHVSRFEAQVVRFGQCFIHIKSKRGFLILARNLDSCKMRDVP